MRLDDLLWENEAAFILLPSNTRVSIFRWYGSSASDPLYNIYRDRFNTEFYTVVRCWLDIGPLEAQAVLYYLLGERLHEDYLGASLH